MNMLTAILNGSPLGDVRATLNHVIGRVFDVTLYGAVADSKGTAGNGTDNTAAVNAAIAAAAAAGGGVVFFPPGTFRVATARIANTTSNVHFRGSGSGTTRLFFDTTEYVAFGRLIHDGGTTATRIANVSIRDITVFGINGVKVAGGAYPGNPGYDGTGCMISVRACVNFLIDGTECYNSPNYGINVLTSSDGMVTNNYSHDHNADGIHVQDSCYRIVVANNDTNNTGDDGIGIGFLNGPVEQIVVANNTVSNCGARGIAIFAPCHGITVIGNVVNGTWLAGILLEAYHYAGAASEYMYNVIVSGNTMRNGGSLAPTHTARGQGYSCGIRVNPVGGIINGVQITDNVVSDSENGHIWITNDGGGTTSNVRIAGNICRGITGIGGLGAATIGSGRSDPSPDGKYPGIVLRNTDLAVVENNVVIDTYHEPVLADASNTFLRISGNTFRNANFSGAAGRSAITVTSGAQAGVDNHYLTAAGVEIGAGGTTPTVIASDDFNRADVPAATGALGNTSVGSKAWSGDGFGIKNQQAIPIAATSTGDYAATGFSAGQADVDVSCTVTLAGAHARIYARASGNGRASTAAYLDTVGNLFYFDGSAAHAVATFAALPTSGTYTLRLITKGNVITGYVNGSQIGTGSPDVTMAAGQNVGIMDDNSGGMNSFDNFSVSAAA